MQSFKGQWPQTIVTNLELLTHSEVRLLAAKLRKEQLKQAGCGSSLDDAGVRALPLLV